MIKRKEEQTKKSIDIWANVPQDAKGRYLEAPTDETGFIIASSKIATVSTQPIVVGQEVGIRETVQVGPNGSVTWYTNGPPGAQVTISPIRVAGSGGHNHGGATTAAVAVGSISPNSFTLPSPYPQNIRSIHRVTDVCGVIRDVWQFSQGSPSTIENRVEVLIIGLQPIPSSQNLRLKPPTAEHPSPYWATPGLIAKLVQLANGYAAKTGKLITITDASLQWGGRFDLNHSWAPPHHEHMDGRQADIRSNDMNESDKRVFLAIAAQVGLSVLDESNHWHVRG